MNFHIKYFGMLAEAVGQSEESWLIDEPLTVGRLRALVGEKYPGLRDKKFKIAVNQQISDDLMPIEGAAEVALLPPFAGG
jgi:sulfur-carrier protein